MRATFGIPTAVTAILVFGVCSACTDNWAAMSSSRTKTSEGSGFYRVGRTGMLCFKEPCPWRGVVPARADGHPLGDVMPWAGDEPPDIAAKPRERERILAAWEDLGCLLVEGRFADKTLEVSRIVGPC